MGRSPWRWDSRSGSRLDALRCSLDVVGNRCQIVACAPIVGSDSQVLDPAALQVVSLEKGEDAGASQVRWIPILVR